MTAPAPARVRHQKIGDSAGGEHFCRKKPLKAVREQGFVGQPGENDLSRSLKIVPCPFVLALWPVIRNAGDIHIAIGEFQTEASGTDNRFIIDHSL